MNTIETIKSLETKWQDIWENQGLHIANPSTTKPKDYVLTMFPYPSGNLHIGHWYNFAPTDAYVRFRRMNGYNTLFPMGFDAFGLPAENAAIKRSISPRTWTYDNIAHMRTQLKSIGTMFDFSREIITSDPEYYKWTQWFFLQFFKHGFAYKQKKGANWCPSCQTVLANEQVVNGTCERCQTTVEQKEIDQWFLKITEFAEELNQGLETLDWSDRAKTIQRNWIGRSEGSEVIFKVKNTSLEIKVFTTRVDTLMGVTYIVVAPEHPLVSQIIAPEQKVSIDQYIANTQNKTTIEREKEKTGIHTGAYALHPITGKELPIYIGDYVLATHGTGAVMAVPAHDSRDFAFAQKYNLPIQQVIATEGKVFDATQAISDEGVLVHSDGFNNMKSAEARRAITLFLKEKGLGKETVFFRLKDWSISRQRYWGAPIPIINCDTCGPVAVPDADLPVLLPDTDQFKPTGESPLKYDEKFYHTTCPKCGQSALRETDTMDTFMCSSWYYLRYTDPQNTQVFASEQAMKYWVPVDTYVGGIEHVTMHLLYARFFAHFLHKFGYISFKEPFPHLKNQGIILGPDGQKMSKSRGNVVDPGTLISEHGIDAVRVHLCFMAQYDVGGPWDPQGINGSVRFIEKIWYTFNDKIPSVDSAHHKNIRNKTIQKVSHDISEFKFNTAISALMMYINALKDDGWSDVDCTVCTQLIAPFAPHIAEELWSRQNKNSIFDSTWPVAENIVDEEVTIVISLNGKRKAEIRVARDFISDEESALQYLKGNPELSNLIGSYKKLIVVPNKIVNIVSER